MHSHSIVISGFPGVGKSEFVRKFSGIGGVNILDSDSSVYSWLPNPQHPNKVRNPEFPDNYIRCIKDFLKAPDNVILVSTHSVVLDALEKAHIKTAIVYPESRLQLDEYLERYRKRGSPDSFIEHIKNNWGPFLTGLENRKSSLFSHFTLKQGEFLSDIFNNIYYLI